MVARSGTAQLAYECVGEASSADVLLIHAGVADRRGWKHVVARLRGRHRCIAYDARGYGDTLYEPEEAWSAVDDALAVLDSAGCERALVVAASMGGRVAVDLALAHPERVTGLVLIGSGVSGAPDEEPGAAAGQLIQAIDEAEASGDLDEVNRLEACLWLDGPAAAEGRVAGAPRQLFLEMNGRALRAVDPGPAAGTPPAWPRLDQINTPALVIIGELDLARMRHISEKLAAEIPAARLVQLPGVAHLPHLEADPTMLNEVSNFADNVEG